MGTDISYHVKGRSWKNTFIPSVVNSEDMIEDSAWTPKRNTIFELKKIKLSDTYEGKNGRFNDRVKQFGWDDYPEDDYPEGYQTYALNSIKDDYVKHGLKAHPPMIFEYENYGEKGESGELRMIDGHHRGTVLNELGYDETYAYVEKKKNRETE